MREALRLDEMPRGGNARSALYRDPNLFLRLDETLGITPDEASVDPDLTSSSKVGDLDITGDATNGYDFEATIAGTSVRYSVTTVTAFANPHGYSTSFIARPGANNPWLRIRLDQGAVSIWVNLLTGVTGTDDGAVSPTISVTELTGGRFLIEVSATPSSGDGRIQLYPVTGDGAGSSAASGIGEVLLTVWDLNPVYQSRIGVHANQARDGVVGGQPASIYDVANALVDEQPLLIRQPTDGRYNVYDGLNDRLKSNTALSNLAHCHGPGGRTYYLVVTLSDVSKTRILCGTGSTGVSDTGFNLTVSSGPSIRGYVGNGGGIDRSYLLNGGAIAPGKYLVAMRFDGTSGHLYLNTTEVDSESLRQPLSLGDPDQQFHLAWPSSALLEGTIHEFLGYAAGHSDAYLAQNLAYLVAKHGIS